MPPRKVTAFFENSQTLYGWSESYYIDVPSYNEAAANAITMLDARMNLATTTTECNWVRISDPTIDRDVFILQKEDLSRNPGSLPTPDAPDFAAVLVRLSAGPQMWSHLFLRGFPRANLNGSDYNPVGGFEANFAAWVAILIGSWQIQTAERVPIIGRAPILGITPANGRGANITAIASPPSVGDTVRIGGVPNSMEGINGYKIVTGIGPTGGDFIVGGARPVGTYPGSGGYWVPVDYVYNNILQVHIKRITHRAAGRPFAQRRGRRSNRIPLRQ